MGSSSNEKKIVITLETFKKNLKLIIKTASKIYEIFYTTLMEQRVGKQLHNNISINFKKFINIKKSDF